MGWLTEELESYKTRKRNRESLLKLKNSEQKYTSDYKPYDQSEVSTTRATRATTTKTTSSTTTTSSTSSGSPGQSQMQLQVENDRMLEEMSRGLFETLSTTESQVLEIARLQSTLQSHLNVQHDLTCRLFDDSIRTIEDTRKGNDYLKRSGKDGSSMRKFLVGLILGMSLLLLMLHYFSS